MAIAVTIDIMKPTTLAFVVPGMTTEYGLKSPLNPTGTVSAGYLQLAGIVGTVLGSFIWGWLGDVIGRRGSILYAGITFIVAGDWVVESRALLYVLLVMPIWGINSVVAVLAVYSAEIYPTLVRSRGTGLAAGASKFGGVLMISLVALGVAAPSIATVALIGAVPLALAAVAVAVWGVETRHRTLEEISGAQADPGLPPPAAVR
jgi:MFS family permease